MEGGQPPPQYCDSRVLNSHTLCEFIFFYLQNVEFPSMLKETYRVTYRVVLGFSICRNWTLKKIYIYINVKAIQLFRQNKMGESVTSVLYELV